MYVGFSAGLQLLDVSMFSLVLLRNEFAQCTVFNRAWHGGNAYGGGVSVYMGGYSTFLKLYSTQAIAGVAVAGDIAIRNVTLNVDTAAFTWCSATITADTREYGAEIFAFGGNAYGGSFSFYVGAYTWSGCEGTTSSKSGSTTVSGVSVYISNVNSSNSRTKTTTQNSYGGSMSVVYIGSYAWSSAIYTSTFIESVCGTTSVTGLVVSISNSTFVGSLAVSGMVFCRLHFRR